MALPTVKVILAVTSHIAFEPLNDSDLLSHAISSAHTFAVENGMNTHLAIAAPAVLMGRVQTIANQSKVPIEFISVNPLESAAFAAALATSQPCDIVGVHDVQRPLTRAAQYHRALAGLVSESGAVRPTTAFTETLKIVGEESELTRTVDRSSMRRLSTPEMYHRSAIDFETSTGSHSWFLPLKEGVTTTEVDADPESLRANNESEVELLEALLHWQQRVVR
mgnify:CR=1 FL=1